MSGIKLSQLPALTSFSPTDTNILFLVANENGTPTSQAVTANTLYSVLTSGSTNEAQGAFNTANIAYTTANIAYTTANSAYTTANTMVKKAGDTMTGALVISNTTTSTSNTTGALVVSGGIGVKGNVFISGNTYTTYISSPVGSSANLILNADGTNDIFITPSTQLFLQDTTASTSNLTGALIVAGGVGVSGNVNCSATINANNMTLNSVPVANFVTMLTFNLAF